MNVDSNNRNPNSSAPQSASPAVPAPRRLRDVLRDQTQAAILSAAEHVLAEQGFDARIQDIAARAGVAVGTLYNHFGDRDGVVAAVLAQGRADLLNNLDAALDVPSGDWLKDLNQFSQVFSDHWRRHGALLAMVVQQPRPAHIAHCDRQAMTQAIRQRVRLVVRRGVECGALRSEIDEMEADLLLGMFWGMLARTLIDGEQGDHMSTAVSLFLHGAAQPPRLDQVG